MSAKWGNAYTNLCSQNIWKAFLPLLKGSIFQDVYWSNCCDTLQANKSMSDVHIIWHNFMKIVGFSFHSLESLLCLDSLAESTFNDPGKYSAVIVIFRFKRYCQIYLLITVNFIFIKYDKAAMLLMKMWTDIASLFFNVKDIIANLAAKTFMRNLCSSIDHSPLVVRTWQLAYQPCNDVSELIIIWGGGKIKDLPSQRVEFSFHHNSCFIASTEIVTFSSNDLWQISFWIFWFWRWLLDEC